MNDKVLVYISNFHELLYVDMTTKVYHLVLGQDLFLRIKDDHILVPLIHLISKDLKRWI